MNNQYRCLKKQTHALGDYSIVPIRMEDRYDIMRWRNEQIYHLRQNKPLTKEKQDIYFNTVISALFKQEQPNQILFSYLGEDKCIGYGGLVHINWADQNAEISFVMDTQLEPKFFENYWISFLGLIEKVAFEDLNLHKLFTHAYDIRPKLYSALEKVGFLFDARLENHCFINNTFYDVVIHSRINPNEKLTYRNASKNDCKLLFDWANEENVRDNSIHSEFIPWEAHSDWFNKKLNSRNTLIYIFNQGGIDIGQVRLEKENENWLIDFSIDRKMRGKGFGYKILKIVILKNSNKSFIAFVKTQNQASFKVFSKLGFINKGIKYHSGIELYRFELPQK